MGASSSLFTPDLANKLSQESLQSFYQYQEEVESQGLEEDEQYYLLEKKFHALIDIDKEMAVIKEKEMKEIAEKAKLEAVKPKHDSFQPDEAHLAMIDHDHSAEESLSAELQLAMSDLKDLNINDFDHTYTQSLVRKVFEIDKYDRLHRQGMKTSHSSESTEEEECQLDKNHHPYTDHSHHGEVFQCHLCNICFDNKLILDSHIEHSDLHRKNLNEREKRLEDAHNEALRLTAVAKNVMNAFYMNLKVTVESPRPEKKLVPANSYEAIMMKVEEEQEHHREVRERWKNSVDKVLHRHMCAKFTHHLMTRINVPRGVELLYDGSKYFHRTKATYDLRFLLHSNFGVLEIVPHYVPFNHDKSVLAETEHDTFLPGKRIYLAHGEILKAFFGYNITHTELADGLHVGEAPLMQNMKGTFHQAEIQAMNIFIMNRLKIHKSHKADDALFFDLHGIAHATLLKELPARFVPVPIEVSVIANIWRNYGVSAIKSPTLTARAAVPSAGEKGENNDAEQSVGERVDGEE